MTCVALPDKLTHADVGQMHLYCNYARAHWTLPDENPPVDLIREHSVILTSHR